MCLTTEGRNLGPDPQRPRGPERDWEHGYAKTNNRDACEVPRRRKGGRVKLKSRDWDSLEAVEEWNRVEVGRVPGKDGT